MPHPERIADPLTAPAWTRARAEPDGRIVFAAAVDYLRNAQAITLHAE